MVYILVSQTPLNLLNCIYFYLWASEIILRWELFGSSDIFAWVLHILCYVQANLIYILDNLNKII